MTPTELLALLGGFLPSQIAAADPCPSGAAGRGPSWPAVAPKWWPLGHAPLLCLLPGPHSSLVVHAHARAHTQARVESSKIENRLWVGSYWEVAGEPAPAPWASLPCPSSRAEVA